ncbi:MAG: 1-acyl-sn-glycerol-3-phosphate acyltransferase [Planctomycetes bacterium]|nr:1-acyl-sn-glycerol-3-phosphate acyltransferase [Planctomycetota bacterium]
MTVQGLEKLSDRIGASDGVLITPNHSHDSDPHVMMEVSKRVGRRFYFMAAWQIFRMHWGIDGWCLQRMGAFSVDREGCDRRAIKQAVELLTTGKSLIVFLFDRIVVVVSTTHDNYEAFRAQIAPLLEQAREMTSPRGLSRQGLFVPPSLFHAIAQDKHSGELLSVEYAGHGLHFSVVRKAPSTN